MHKHKGSGVNYLPSAAECCSSPGADKGKLNYCSEDVKPWKYRTVYCPSVLLYDRASCKVQAEMCCFLHSVYFSKWTRRRNDFRETKSLSCKHSFENLKVWDFQVGRSHVVWLNQGVLMPEGREDIVGRSRKCTYFLPVIQWSLPIYFFCEWLDCS